MAEQNGQYVDSRVLVFLIGVFPSNVDQKVSEIFWLKDRIKMTPEIRRKQTADRANRVGLEVWRFGTDFKHDHENLIFLKVMGTGDLGCHGEVGDFSAELDVGEVKSPCESHVFF